MGNQGQNIVGSVFLNAIRRALPPKKTMGALRAAILRLGLSRSPPVAADPAPVDRDQLMRDHRKRAREGISIFSVRARIEAARRAGREAEAAGDAEQEQRRRAQVAEQARARRDLGAASAGAGERRRGTARGGRSRGQAARRRAQPRTGRARCGLAAAARQRPDDDDGRPRAGVRRQRVAGGAARLRRRAHERPSPARPGHRWYSCSWPISSRPDLARVVQHVAAGLSDGADGFGGGDGPAGAGSIAD